MWPFKGCDCAQRIRDLTQERDEADDAYTALLQAKGAAEMAMSKMRKATTPDGVSEMAAKVTALVADIYAAGSPSVKARDIRVHAAIAHAIREAVNGEPHWSEGSEAAKFYRERV